MIVLGCETSCDETGLAIYDTERGLLTHALFSQIELHALYGGVVPELASRDHVQRWVPLTRQVLREAGLGLADLNAVAYTTGPGLAGALLTGAMAARSLAWSLDVPALGVHHMEAHLLAPLLESPAPPFPFICLLVSGGHTQLVRVERPGDYRLLGESMDDAAGEAFDKTAKMLGLPYPGGPHLAQLALQGDSRAFDLPRPLLDRPGLDFSFSGLKTAALTQLKRHRQLDGAHGADQAKGRAPGDAGGTAGGEACEDADEHRFRADMAASFEAAVVDTLLGRCERALRQENLTRLVISGGVSANLQLRAGARSLGDRLGCEVYYPRLAFCTDNGAMIALAGAMRLAAGEYDDLALTIRPRWPLEELAAETRFRAGQNAPDVAPMTLNQKQRNDDVGHGGNPLTVE